MRRTPGPEPPSTQAPTALATSHAAATANVRPGREGQGHVRGGDCCCHRVGLRAGGWRGAPRPPSPGAVPTLRLWLEFSCRVPLPVRHQLHLSGASLGLLPSSVLEALFSACVPVLPYPCHKLIHTKVLLSLSGYGFQGGKRLTSELFLSPSEQPDRAVTRLP